MVMQPADDAITSHPTYRAALTHYLQHAPPDEAHRLAYQWTVTQLPAPPTPEAPQRYVTRTTTRVGLSSAAHLGHLIATICTCGLWAPIWLLSAWIGRKERGTSVTTRL